MLVGNESRDDAAVYDAGHGLGIISTTDFFMPIVDDPYTFGRIAATNAISDIYAMGGRPIMAVAILGFPIKLLPPEVAQRIVEGGRAACRDAGISLAGGHSIDAPEPIFGLAVTGVMNTQKVKKNNSAKAGCKLFLSKPLGTGILTTAEKKGKLKKEHSHIAVDVMCHPNKIGTKLAEIEGVSAMTDVTGFGLLGHLIELCEGSKVKASIKFDKVPLQEGVDYYISKKCIPGGTGRNFESYGEKIAELGDKQRAVLCDPQTSGGLLIAVHPDSVDEVLALAEAENETLTYIGELVERVGKEPFVEVI